LEAGQVGLIETAEDFMLICVSQLEQAGPGDGSKTNELGRGNTNQAQLG
jgi:hypothetical protein